MGFRAIIIAFIGLTGSGASLVRPYVGMLLLAVMYFFRPEIYGAEEYITPVKWLTVSALLGYLATRRGTVPLHRLAQGLVQPSANASRGAVAATAPRAVQVGTSSRSQATAQSQTPTLSPQPEPMMAGTGWMLVILSVYLISTIFAPLSSAESWDRLWLIVKIFVAVFLIQKVCDTPARLAGFVAAMILGACWFLKVTIFGWAMYGWGDIRIDAAVGQGGGANYIAWVLAAMMGFVYYKAVRGRNWQRWVAIGLIPLMLVGNMATGSRGGLLCLAAASVVFALMMHRWTLLLAGAAGVLLFVTFAPATYMERMSTITTDPSQMDTSALSRYQNVQLGKRIIADYPLFGTGLETFPRAKRPYIMPDYVGGLHHVAHNTLIQLGSECGIPMLIVFAGVSGVAAWRLLRRRQLSDPQDDDHLEWLRVGTLCALVAIWVEMLKGDIAHNDLFWWFYGLAFAYHRTANRYGATRPSKARAPLTIKMRAGSPRSKPLLGEV